MSFFRHPLLPALFCAVLWGSAFPVIKTVYLQWSEASVVRTLPLLFLFAGIRFVIAGGALLIAGRNLRAEIRATPIRLLLGLAVTQTLIQYVLFYQAVALSSGSLTALLVSTGSFWWMILAPMLGKSPWPNAWQWLSLAVGGIGVTLAVYAPGAGAGNPILGSFLMLAATASGALAIIIYQEVKKTMAVVNATGLSLSVGGCGLVCLGLPAIGEVSVILDPEVLGWTLWLAFVSAAAFSVWNHLSTLFPVSLLACYRFLIPICGVIEALLFLEGEEAGWGLLLGGFLVVGSMFSAQRLALRRP